MPSTAVILAIEHTHYYGCVRCQTGHDGGALGTPRDPLYDAHLYWQDKHGVRSYTEHHCWDLDGPAPVEVPACKVLRAGEY